MSQKRTQSDVPSAGTVIDARGNVQPAEMGKPRMTHAVPASFPLAQGEPSNEAIRLADALEQGTYLLSNEREATATELRRLHAAVLALKPAVQEGVPFDQAFDEINWDEWRNQPIRELVRMLHSRTKPAVPDGWRLVPVDPTPEMVSAYLTANAEYWYRTDEMPNPPGRWRTGTPRDATVAGYAAMLAAAPQHGGA